jgi:hypothetical protein
MCRRDCIEFKKWRTPGKCYTSCVRLMMNFECIGFAMEIRVQFVVEVEKSRMEVLGKHMVLKDWLGRDWNIPPLLQRALKVGLIAWHCKLHIAS